MSATGDALKDRIKVLTSAARGTQGRPDAVADQSGVPIDTADVEVPEVSPSGMVGPRGIDTSGRVRVRHIGTPPAQQPGAGQQEFTQPKARTFPFPTPPQLARSNPIAVTGSNPGMELHNVDVGFPVHGLVVDNYSTIWLYFPSLAIYVPPSTVRFSQPLPAGVGRLKVVAEAPPGVTQPSLTAGGVFEYTATENEVDYSPGICFALSSSGGGGGAITAPLGSKLSAASVSVVIASDQGAVAENLTEVGGAALALGQTTRSASLPVTMASDQNALDIINSVQRFADSAATLAGNATFTGTGRDTNGSESNTGYSRFRVFVNSDQSGTIFIEQSPDNATWYSDYSQAFSGGSPSTYEYICCMRYVRVVYTNGATGQTTFTLQSALFAI